MHVGKYSLYFINFLAQNYLKAFAFIHTIDSTIVGTLNGTMTRKKEESIKEDILVYLEQIPNSASTKQIAEAIDRAWHSVQNRCLKLQLEDKIKGFKVGRMNLWEIKDE